MKIYIIQKESDSISSHLPNTDFVDLSQLTVDDSVQPIIKPQGIEHAEFCRGYPLSQFELSVYNRHYHAWKDLADSGDEYGIVLENVNTILYTMSEIRALVSAFDSSWQIYFPFDGFKKKTMLSDSYVLGFRWGTDAYFVNRSCLPLLLSHTKIAAPVDEQLLLFNKKNLINIDYEEIDVFEYGDSIAYEKDCNKSKLDQILGTNVWSKEDLSIVQQMLNDLSGLFNENGIDFFISDGTLLGYVRHRQIMAWDDDIDLSIERSEVPKLLKAVNSSKKYNILKRYWGKYKYEYYKIWNNKSDQIRDLPYGFPFVDVWIYDNKENDIVYNHGLEVPLNYIFPTRKALFEGALVTIPKEPLHYLDIKYPEWREQIRVYSWSHKKEKSGLFPLSAKISVDVDGLICSTT
ncbi:LicD family protein [Pedobacter sp. ok626]|uniref:LicD family protein n=1 Tax=Pedobacter sp. ok626 TaxID=1761882 RepID=UPI000888A86A|nr:LicD family protein [Pedobacter sp. ok626]SDK92649.1 LicD family protein [Pedobacter sp. ok626]